MNLFDILVEQALSSSPDLTGIQPVVEKEILHHDILREMNGAGFLSDLTFIGGSCLRYCYGSERLSEDLDFTGGRNFAREGLMQLGITLSEAIESKYGLKVSVKEPVCEKGDVDTWKIRVITRPEQPDLPSQKIHIDICAAESYEKKPVMLKNPYGFEMGTGGMILYAESREEILSDKVMALATRPNRVKNRDIWDILWLTQHKVTYNKSLLERKLDERKIEQTEFYTILKERIESLSGKFEEYKFEMQRFLPGAILGSRLEQKGYWDYTLSLLREFLT